MSGELEAAGALTTAGLAAGAIDGPNPGEAGEGACANCGATLTGRFCANCGQAAKPHRSLWGLVEEMLVGLFNFDTKLWRTVPMVIFRPGTLTRNYVHGKRARYIGPLALFLFCIFFLFFVFSAMPPPLNVNDSPSDSQASAQEHLNDAREGLQDVQQQLTELRQQMATQGVDAGDRTEEAALQTAVNQAQAEVHRRERDLQRAQAAEQAQHDQAQQHAQQSGVHVNMGAAPPNGPLASITTSDDAPATTTPPATSSATPIAAPPTPPAVPAAANPYPEGTLENVLYRASQEGGVNVDNNPVLTQQLRQKLSNPPLFLYKLQEAASKFSFLLVPISLPFIAFLFLFKRGVTLYDHAVYALYALCFASLAFSAVVAFSNVPWMRWFPALLITFGLPTHIFFHLGGAYSLGWFSALWRTFFMLFFAIIALVIFLGLVFFIGLTG